MWFACVWWRTRATRPDRPWIDAIRDSLGSQGSGTSISVHTKLQQCKTVAGCNIRGFGAPSDFVHLGISSFEMESEVFFKRFQNLCFQCTGRGLVCEKSDWWNPLLTGHENWDVSPSPKVKSG